MKHIQLTKDRVAIIDDRDYKRVSRWSWYYDRYAKRNHWDKKNKKYVGWYMHAFIMKTPRGMDTDHINGNKLDNRRSNLRILTRSQNKVSGSLRRKDSTTGVQGVHFDKSRNKYMAFICVNGKMNNLGRFNNKEDAIIIRKLAEKQYLTNGELDYKVLTDMIQGFKKF
jgi:hypothetical protein